MAAMVRWPSEHFIRFTGTALEVFGLTLVFRELLQAGRQFKRPALLQAVGGFFGELAAAIKPPAAQQHVLKAEGIATGVRFGNAQMEIVPRTLEERVQNLEGRFEVFGRQITDQIQETSARIGQTNKSLDVEVSERRRALSKLEVKLTKFAVGDLYVALVGGLLTLVGLLASNMAHELSIIL